MDRLVPKPGKIGSGGNGKAAGGAGAPAAGAGGGAGASIERDLRAAVDQIAARVLPERGRVTELIRMHSSYHSSYPIDELSVGFADGSSLQMVFKNLCPEPQRQAGGPRRV